MLHFGRSKDGRLRANVNVRFRVGIDLLEAAGQEIVWRRIVSDTRPVSELGPVAERHARSLTRGSLEKEVRSILQARGYAGYERDDEYYTLAEGPVEARVRELYQEVE